MNDDHKTKAELIEELQELRRQVARHEGAAPGDTGDSTQHDSIESRLTPEQLRELTDSLPHLVWTCGADGPCDYLSRQWIDYTGIPEAEQLGYGWLEQLHPDDRDRVPAEWSATVGAGRSFDIEFRIRRADGVYRWFKTRAIPIRNAGGKLVTWYGSNTDTEDYKTAAMRELTTKNALLSQEIQQRASVEQALAESMEKLEMQAKDLREANEQIVRELRLREEAEAAREAVKEHIIAMQRDRLLEISAPLIPISEGILVMPLIGTIDAERSRLVLETALQGTAERGAGHFIIDITGVKMVDATTATLLLTTARGLQLLGARAIITGVNPRVAQTFVQLCPDFGGLVTVGTVQAGLERALAERRRLSARSLPGAGR